MYSSFLTFLLDPFSEKFLESAKWVDVEKLCMEAINEFLYDGKLYSFLSDCVKLPGMCNKHGCSFWTYFYKNSWKSASWQWWRDEMRTIAFYVPFFLVCLLRRLFLLAVVRQNIKLHEALVWPVQQFIRKDMVLCKKCSKIWWDNWTAPGSCQKLLFSYSRVEVGFIVFLAQQIQWSRLGTFHSRSHRMVIEHRYSAENHSWLGRLSCVWWQYWFGKS